MPHLRPLRNEEAAPESRAMLDSLEAKLGQVPNMYRTFAHAPKIFSATVAMAQAIRSELAPNIRELAYLKVADLTDCHVCRHYHEFQARRAGLTDEQIRDLARFEESAAYTEQERDVLHFAEQWSAAGKVDETVLERLKLSLSSEQLVILAATVAQANFTSRFNNVFGVELP